MGRRPVVDGNTFDYGHFDGRIGTCDSQRVKSQPLGRFYFADDGAHCHIGGHLHAYD